VLALVCAPAYAGDHVVQRGETLEHVADQYGCTVDSVLRANHLTTTLVKAGTVVTIPSCTMKTRARTRERVRERRVPDDDAARARQALAVIDGTSVVAPSRDPEIDDAAVKPRVGERLPSGDGYRIRRLSRAFGAPHVVDHLQAALTIVRALYPDVHTLAIGDLSAPEGGKLANHLSHQTGLDVDLGFFFKKRPDGYPQSFIRASLATIHFDATWLMLTTLAGTSSNANGVERMFLSYEIQRLLYDLARKRGVDRTTLGRMFQYPRGTSANVGLIRHEPGHDGHVHVRFKCPLKDRGCG
jgi:LysM repeat protein